MPEGRRGFGGGGHERYGEEIESGGESAEAREAREKREMALEIIKLWADLIEKGVEWDDDQKKAVRAQIQAGLAALRVDSITDNRFFDILYPSQDLKPKVPKDYPTFEEFSHQYGHILSKNEQQPGEVNWKTPPSLGELAKHSYIDNWKHVKGRDSLEVEQYLYQLGRLLCDQKSYEEIFPATDNISTKPNGWLQNGRHRVLILKCLGENFINQNRLDSYIKVNLEKIE